LNRLAVVVHGGHGVEGRFQKVRLESSLGGRRKVVKGICRLEVGRESIEAHKRSIVDELGHVSSSEMLLMLLLLLLLLLLLKGPICQGIHGRLERRLL
jgi:hypothetical protein